MENLMKNYENLAAAVVGQACEDYCYALRHKKQFKEFKDEPYSEGGKKYRRALVTIADCTEFFKTGLYKYMDNPPQYEELIKRLKYVANHPDKFKIVRFLKNTTGEEV